jgi:hypothetical protein
MPRAALLRPKDMMDATPPNFIAADRRHRSWAIFTLVFGTVLGALILGWLWPMARSWLLEERGAGRIPSRAICLGFLGLVGLLAVPVIYVGLNVIRLSTRVIAHQQFPPPGMKVVRDTRILRGSRAVTWGRAQRVIGSLLILCATALFGLSAYAASLLL